METRVRGSSFLHGGRVTSSPTDSGSAFSQPSNMTREPVAVKSGIGFVVEAGIG